MNPNNRRKYFGVSADYVAQLFSNGLVCNAFISLPRAIGLPVTAFVCGCYFEPCENSFRIVVQDESFDEVKQNQMIPRLEVTFESVRLPRDK